MLLLAWTPLALAQARDPLPALPVERPVVLPRGWALVDAGLEHVGSDDRARDTLLLSARYAAMRRAEVRAAVPLVWAHTPTGARFRRGDPELGLRFRLHCSEPPNRSLGLDVSVRTPRGPGVPIGALGLVGGAQAGPFLATLGIGARTNWSAYAEPALLVQIGPLFPYGVLHVELDDDGVGARARGGLGIQLDRALEISGWLGVGRAGLGLEVAA